MTRCLEEQFDYVITVGDKTNEAHAFFPGATLNQELQKGWLTTLHYDNA